MSHTKYVFVVNNADGTGMQTTEANLGLNDLGVYDNGEFQTTIGALDAGDTFQLANSQYSSPRFNFDDIVKKGDVDGQAGTSQVIEVHVFKEEDDSAEIKLIDVSQGREKFAIATFEAVGAATDAAAAVQIKDAINASKRDVFKDVSAAIDGTDDNQVNITMPKNVVMRFACNDLSDGAIATDAILSVGTVADVNAEFEDGLPFLGVTNIAGPNVVKPASNASGQYDRACIYVEAEVGDRKDLHEIVIYFKADNNEVAGNLATVFAYSTTTTQT